MRTWNAVEDVAGEHFYDWSIGEIVNGQQIIESSGSGLSSRCSAIPEAASRTSGPAPHALYFAYQPTETAGQFEALEACYDPSGNMVALFRLQLGGCGADPLDEASSDWDASCTTQTIEWQLDLEWDENNRLARVEKTGTTPALIRNVFDTANLRVIRLDEVTTEGNDQATLYVGRSYEIRDATVLADGTYFGGEETKFVFHGEQRIARVVERLVPGATAWPNAPGRAYVFHTLTNHLSSASVTFDSEVIAGQSPIVVAQAQLPYGAEDIRVESPHYGGYQVDYEFTDKEQDPDIGLMYFGARFYAPNIGRWGSVDPLYFHWLPERNDDGIVQLDLIDIRQTNGYSYVLNHPVNLQDPTGENIWENFGAFVNGMRSASPPGAEMEVAMRSREFQALRTAVSQISEGDVVGGVTRFLTYLNDPVGVQERIRHVVNQVYAENADYSSLQGWEILIVPFARCQVHGVSSNNLPSDSQAVQAGFFSAGQTFVQLFAMAASGATGGPTGGVRPRGGGTANGLGGRPPTVRGTQVGLRNPAAVDQIKADMLSGNYDFTSARGRIGGIRDANGVYHVGEGHHRMAAAQEIFRETGNPAYVNRLIREGVWTDRPNAPATSRPLPSRSFWGRLRNLLGL